MNNHTQFDPTQIPPPLMTRKSDDLFAHKTMAIRKPGIVQQVLAQHAGQYPAEIRQALQDLHDEMAQGQPVRPLETTAPDGESWHQAWQPHQHKTWFDIPWYFAEVFFYRRLLEASGYFGTGQWAGIDPFLPSKQAELQNEIPWHILSLALEYASKDSADNFCALLRYCIWGNRVDLSHPKIVEEIRQQAAQQKLLGEAQQKQLGEAQQKQLGEAQQKQLGEAQQKQLGDLLADDTEAVLAHLQKAAPASAQIDFICDNTGTELLLDFALLDYLLKFDWARAVTLHVKAHPTYVSDTTPADVDMAIAAIKKQATPEMPSLADRLAQYQQEGRLRIQSHLFWNSSRFFWEIPAGIHTQLARAHLVIIKGDANYRRLLGDGHWAPDVPFAEAIPYFPAPFVTLRTMKSNVVTGLQPGQAEKLDQEDPEWRVNGRRGVIQAII